MLYNKVCVTQLCPGNSLSFFRKIYSWTLSSSLSLSSAKLSHSYQDLVLERCAFPGPFLFKFKKFWTCSYLPQKPSKSWILGWCCRLVCDHRLLTWAEDDHQPLALLYAGLHMLQAVCKVRQNILHGLYVIMLVKQDRTLTGWLNKLYCTFNIWWLLESWK